MNDRRPRARRGRSRQPIPQTLPDDLYDYADDPTPRRSPSRSGRSDAFDVDKLPVTDDWPEMVPITEAEIRVFERWFADVFDEMFGPLGSPETDLISLSQSDNEKP